MTGNLAQPSSDRQAKLARLVEVSLVLNSTLALDPLLSTLMDAATELVAAESAAILLMDRDTRELVFTASNSAATVPLIGQPVPLEGSIAGAIMQENRPLALDDVRQDPRHYRQLDERLDFETRSLLGVPMRIKEDVVGVLEVVNKRDGSWTPDDRETLLILASQAAVAIENARLVEALRKAYAELDQLDQLKDEFIAIASHELRTPLGIILGYASFLREDVEGESGELADVVYRSALQLRTIIEQMTNLRYLKMGEIELSRETVQVSSLLQAAQQDIASLAEAKNHDLQIRLPEADYRVSVDVARMVEALGNLLNNAVKFTPPGGSIRVDAVGKPTEIWITVQDSGVGFDPAQSDRLFDEFYQVENHLTRRHSGMGLGLSIARALVEAHGGRLWAHSTGADQGATFTVSLALVPAEADAPAAV
jgi:signal transduction histidine kinase